MVGTGHGADPSGSPWYGSGCSPNPCFRHFGHSTVFLGISAIFWTDFWPQSDPCRASVGPVSGLSRTCGGSSGGSSGFGGCLKVVFRWVSKSGVLTNFDISIRFGKGFWSISKSSGFLVFLEVLKVVVFLVLKVVVFLIFRVQNPIQSPRNVIFRQNPKIH